MTVTFRHQYAFSNESDLSNRQSDCIDPLWLSRHEDHFLGVNGTKISWISLTVPQHENAIIVERGILILSVRKRAKPTAAELDQRKQEKLQIKCKQVALSSLRHKIMALYDHGCFMENWQFPPKSNKFI